MKITENILENLKKYHLTRKCFHSRVARGWTVADAQRTPIVKQGYNYEVFASRAGVAKNFCGSQAVADFLTQRTHRKITKNMIVGQVYRKGYAIIDNFLVKVTQ